MPAGPSNRAADADFRETGGQSSNHRRCRSRADDGPPCRPNPRLFDIPTDNLYAAPVFGRDMEEAFNDGEETVIVSPDVGGVVRARAIARRIDADLAIIDKRRERRLEVMNIIGDVDGQRCILVDDIVDSAGTLCNAAVALKEAGAVRLAPM